MPWREQSQLQSLDARAQPAVFSSYHKPYHNYMTTMLSLRLSSEQESRISALAARQGMTRSEWLRMAIARQIAAADTTLDSHAIYLELTAPLRYAELPGSGRGNAARQHSRILKHKLHASRRR
jgi:predicted DNA binding CopG/RHH family protein